MIYAQVHLTLPAWASTDIDPLARFDNDEARMRFVAGLARRTSNSAPAVRSAPRFLTATVAWSASA